MKTFKFLCLLTMVISTMILSSCANEMTFKNEKGDQFTATPYGWMNENEKKIDSVQYEVNAGNIVWDVIAFETVIVPILLTGDQLYEPVGMKPTVKQKWEKVK